MNPNDISEPAVDPHRAVVDALLDGEGVEKEALRDALGRPDVRDYLVDVLLLRRLAIEMGPTSFPAAAHRSTPGARVGRWVAAAAVLMATATTSYLVGRDQVSGVLTEPAGVSAVATLVDEAPPPTRTIRFERGRNWVSNLEEK